MPIDIVFTKEDEIAKQLGYKLLVIGKDAVLAKNQNQAKGKFVIAEVAPWSVKDKRINLLFNAEIEDRKDFIHHKASGLNQVICKDLARNKVTYCFNFSLLLGKNRDVILGRMKQNVKLCRKYKVKMAIASFAKTPYEMRDPKDLQAFGVTIGMHPSEAKKALQA